MQMIRKRKMNITLIGSISPRNIRTRYDDEIYCDNSDSFEISFISSVNDIYPLAVQFTNEHNDEVRVRVKSIRDEFHNKIIEGKSFKKKYRLYS